MSPVRNNMINFKSKEMITINKKIIINIKLITGSVMHRVRFSTSNF